MTSRTGWAASAILLVVICYMAHLLAVKPKEVVREVPKIVTQEVIREVPKEIIKEVPREVIREVPVEKLVDKPIPQEYLYAYQFYQSWSNPSIDSNQSDALRGIKSFSVTVVISDNLAQSVSKASIKNKIELELRKLGIKVDDNEPFVIYYYLEATTPSGPGIVGYYNQLDVTQAAVVPRQPRFIAVNATIWTSLQYGTIGSMNLSQLETNIDTPLTAFLNDYLKANPSSR